MQAAHRKRAGPLGPDTGPSSSKLQLRGKVNNTWIVKDPNQKSVQYLTLKESREKKLRDPKELLLDGHCPCPGTAVHGTGPENIICTQKSMVYC